MTPQPESVYGETHVTGVKICPQCRKPFQRDPKRHKGTRWAAATYCKAKCSLEARKAGKHQ